jgi:tetratricopeptide (TPR) repeat protein
MAGDAYSAQTTTLPARFLTSCGYQLLLVPEAVFLTLLLGLHTTAVPATLTLLVGTTIIAWFVVRLSLLLAARRAIAGAAYIRAERLARFAHRMHPGSADGLALLGSIALARGQIDPAIDYLRRASKWMPNHADYQALLSAALLETGALIEAREVALKALQVSPGCAPAHLSLAQADQMLGRPPALVEQHLRIGLACTDVAAETAALYCALASHQFAADMPDAAEASLARIEQILPACPFSQRAALHYYIAELLRDQGYTERARNHYQASEQLDPHGRYAADAWRSARL